MPILDNAHIGRPDTQDGPLDFIAHCACGCRQIIHFGDDGIWKFDGILFASSECFAKWSGAFRMDGIWS